MSLWIETGEEVLDASGNKVTSERTFTAEAVNGTVDVIFTFNGSNLAGKTTVVFEDLYYGEQHYATHADIEDEGQTIYFPEIGTTAKDAANGDKKLAYNSDVELIDTVAYKNLVPGMNYKVTGVLMDKETGEEILTADGNRITAETTFTAETASGSIDVSYFFNTNDLEGKTIVVFEELYLVNEDGTELLIAEHKDMKDEGQTVKVDVPVPPTPKTGDDFTVVPIIILGVAAVSGFILLFIKRKKRNVEKID